MRGIVYAIRSPHSNLVYYGSTIQPLSQRMAGHRSGQKNYLAGKGTHYCSSYEILALGDAYIELVQVVEFTVKAELHAVEGAMIRGNECVNKVQAGRTRAQYLVDNVEELRQKTWAYQAANAAKLNAINTCGCGGQFQTRHKAVHAKTNKHQAWATQAI